MATEWLLSHRETVGAALLVLMLLTVAMWRLRQSKALTSNLASDTPRPTLELRTVQVGEWEIRYHLSGTGPSLVLLHGIGANLHCWRDLIPLLNPDYQVLALDLPGFGQSSKHPGPHYGLDGQVALLGKILDAFSINQTYVVGNSMGGNIALWFGLQAPERVRALCLIAPATEPGLVPLPVGQWTWLGYPTAWLTNRYAMRWVHGRTVSKRHLVDTARIQETMQTYSRNPLAVRAFLAATAAIRDPRLNQELDHLKIPIQLLWGSRDRLISRKIMDRLEQALPQAESHVHLGGGHHLQEDEPEWVKEKIDTFFKHLSST